MPLFRRSLALLERALGPQHPQLADVLTDIGIAQLGLRAPRNAVTPLRRAVALREAHPGDPTDLAEARFTLARALWDAGQDRPRARTLALEARDAYTAAGPRSKKNLAEVNAWLPRHR